MDCIPSFTTVKYIHGTIDGVLMVVLWCGEGLGDRNAQWKHRPGSGSLALALMPAPGIEPKTTGVLSACPNHCAIQALLIS